MLDSGAFFLSADFQFYAYDWRRLRKGPFGTVVLPNQLLQLLRPFLPKTEDFDRGFVETFAIPEVRGLGAGGSLTASKVLSYLNTYRDVEEETAVRILANEVLLGRLKDVEEGTRQFQEEVESALAQDNAVLLEEREATRREAEQARTESEAMKAEADAIRRQAELAERKAKGDQARLIEVQRQAEETERTAAEALRIEQEEKRIAIEAKNDELQALKKEYEKVDKSAKETRLIVGFLAGIILLLIIYLLPWIMSWDWLLNHPNKYGLYGSATAINVALVWAFLSEKRRSFALGVVGIGALLVLLQLLGG